MKEKEKYKQIWATRNYRSGKSEAFARIVEANCSGRVLDMGCGNCETSTYLSCRIKYYGLDITTDQIKLDVPVFERPAWEVSELPLDFKWAVSNDFLEHLPTDKVEETIKGIMDVTKEGTIHAISTREAISDYNGHKVHLTVRPLEWWQEQFDKHNKGIKVLLFDADKI